MSTRHPELSMSKTDLTFLPKPAPSTVFPIQFIFITFFQLLQPKTFKLSSTLPFVNSSQPPINIYLSESPVGSTFKIYSESNHLFAMSSANILI